jgi:hypothetical protein
VRRRAADAIRSHLSTQTGLQELIMRAGLTAAVFAAAMAASATAQAGDLRDDFGWGGYYSQHLSEYDGRPLGPPLPALPPGYQYYNGRLIQVVDPSLPPYGFHGPTHSVRVHRAPRRVQRHR